MGDVGARLAPGDALCQPPPQAASPSARLRWATWTFSSYRTPLRRQCHRTSSHRLPSARTAAWCPLPAFIFPSSEFACPNALRQAAKSPLVNRGAEIMVVGEAARHHEVAFAGPASDRGSSGVTLQCVRGIELVESFTDFSGDPGGELSRAPACSGKSPRPGTPSPGRAP